MVNGRSAMVQLSSKLTESRKIKLLSQVLRYEPTEDTVRAVLKEKTYCHGENWVRDYFSDIPNAAGLDGGLLQQLVADKSEWVTTTTIVLIEASVESLIPSICKTFESAEEAFENFKVNVDFLFTGILKTPIAGFKTVIGYRTGLAIPSQPSQEKALKAFQLIYDQLRKSSSDQFKLEHEGLNEYILHLLAELINNWTETRKRKPILFDIGLGDDVVQSKLSSSPSQLQPFIKQYQSVPIVILHAGYPFARETGYLASLYSNVYVNLGLIFPTISRDGQENVVRLLLEICSSEKIMLCADLPFIPEVWALAMQMRQTFESVLWKHVARCDLTSDQARQYIENILFRIPKKVYNLVEKLLSPLVPLAPQGETDVPQHSSAKLETMLNGNKAIQYLRLCWMDFSGWMRVRIIPRHRALALLQSKGGLKLSISKAALGVLQNDSLIRGVGPSGDFNLIADCSSLRPAPKEGQILVMGDFKEKDGSPVIVCPRTQLRRVLDLAAGHSLIFMLGFEIEFVLMRRTGARTFEPLDTDAHQWCLLNSADYSLPAMTVIEEAVAHLAKADIHVETMHPESSFGQYEIVLPAMPALEAVDALVYARHILSTCANKQGLKMTLHPKPFEKSAGTAAHVHMSFSSPDGSDQGVHETFYAGILKHLRSIIAYTCSSTVSYDRVVDGYWAGGTWVAWGVQNRETPLRKIEGSHWELKCMDGMANPYLAMSAIIAARMCGVTDKQEMQWKECVDDPASLSQTQREQLGIVEKLPLTLEEALNALKQDEKLRQLLGEEAVQRYLDVKEGEIEMLRSMNQDVLRSWVIERY